MKRQANLIAYFLMAALVSPACHNAGKRTAIGAGAGAALGAVTGAIIGNQTGDRDKGALIGAGLGGMVGSGIGYKLDKQAKELEAVAETRRTDEGIITTLKENILFPTGSYALKPTAGNAVSQISSIIKKYPEDKIVVIGHTDDVGSENFNQTLSEKRAGTVRSYMIAQGIPAASVEAVGLGESSPLVPNTNDANRAKNRRVELSITMPDKK
jgi:outer membrane protein OmpA-like peptidoglycan-associated protein